MELTQDELEIMLRLVKREEKTWEDMELLKVSPDYKRGLERISLKIRDELL